MKKTLLLFTLCLSLTVVFAQQDKLNQQLFEACEQGNVDEVKALIENGADISQGENDSTYLVLLYLLNTIEKPELASFTKSLSEDDVFEILLSATQHGFNVFDKYSVKIPCVEERWDEETWLLVQVVNPDCIYVSYNLYFIIVEHGRFNDFEQSIIQNINSGKYPMQSDSGSTPLHIACEAANSVAVVDALIKKGADVNAVDKDWHTPLLLCLRPDDFECSSCRINQFPIAKLLLQSGAKADYYNFIGHNPLTSAFFEKQYDIAKLLIENGADLSGKPFLCIDSTEVPTPMSWYMCQYSGYSSVMPSNWFTIDSAGQEKVDEIIFLAVKNGLNVFEAFSGSLPCTEVMVDEWTGSYMEVVREDCYKWSVIPYYSYVEQGRFKEFENSIIQNINSGIYPKLTSSGSTPLHLACETANSVAVVEALIKNGTDVNAIDSEGLTPLTNCIRPRNFFCDSCRVARLEIALLLLKSGAKVDYLIPSEYSLAGHSPLLFACLSKDYELAKLLIESGADVSGKEFVRNDSTRVPAAMFFYLMQISGDCPNGFEDLAVKDSVDKMQVYEILSMSVIRGFNVFEPLQGSIPTVEEVYDTIYFHYYQQYKNISVEYLPYSIIAKDNMLPQFEKLILKQIKQKKYTGSDIYGNTALHYACAYGNSVTIVKALVKSGAEMYVKNENGKTPADLAKENGHMEVYNFISGKMK